MKTFSFKYFGIRFRVELVNFDESISLKDIDLSEDNGREADVNLYFYKNQKAIFPLELRRKYKRPFFELFDLEKRIIFCMSEKNMDLTYLLNFQVNEAMLALQNYLNIVFLHAASLVVDKKAIMFVAPSGGGKSTIAQIAGESGYRVLGEDTSILRLDGKEYLTQKYPFNITSERSEGSHKVDKIFFLEKSDVNKIRPVTRIGSLRKFIPETNILYPIDYPEVEKIKSRRRVISFLEEMMESVDCEIFEFRKDAELFSCLGI